MRRSLAYFCLYRCLDAENALYWLIDRIRAVRGRIVRALYRHNERNETTDH